MTPVIFHFLSPSGEPIANTQFQIQLGDADSFVGEDGLIMPYILRPTTNEEGKVTVDLKPTSKPYYLTIRGPDIRKILVYKFYVPGSEEAVRFQDLLNAEGPAEPIDEALYTVVMEAKASVLSNKTIIQGYVTTVEAARVAAVGSAEAAALSAIEAFDSAQEALAAEQRTLAAAAEVEGALDQLKYSEVTATNTVTVDVKVDSYRKITLTASDCVLTLVALPEFDIVDGIRTVTLQLEQSTGSNKVTWPGSIIWAHGREPILSYEAGYFDLVRLVTLDNGASWIGSYEGGWMNG